MTIQKKIANSSEYDIGVKKCWWVDDEASWLYEVELDLKKRKLVVRGGPCMKHCVTVFHLDGMRTYTIQGADLDLFCLWSFARYVSDVISTGHESDERIVKAVESMIEHQTSQDGEDYAD